MKQNYTFPWAYFLIAYLFTWTFQIPVVLDSQKIISLPFPPQIFLLISIFGPFVSAFFLTWQAEKKSGMWQLLKRGFKLRMPFYVYLFVIFVSVLTTFCAFSIVGGDKFNSDVVSLLGTFVLYFFLGGSFGEEFGWRGYALPRLLQNHNPLIASLIIGILWAIWHLPLFWLVGTSQFYTPIWLFFIYVIALAIQYTWIYIRTNGNIFACLLLHTFTNITVEIFPIESVNGVDKRIYYETLFAMIIAIILFIFFFNKPNFLSHKNPEKEK